MDSVHETPDLPGKDGALRSDGYQSLPGMLANTANRSTISQFLPALSRGQFAALSRGLDVFVVFMSFILAEQVYVWYFDNTYQVAQDYTLVALCCALTYYFVAISTRAKSDAVIPVPFFDVTKTLAISFVIVLTIGFILKLSEMHSRAWFSLAFLFSLGLLWLKFQALHALVRGNLLKLPIIESIALYGSGAPAVKKALEAESDGLCEVHLYNAGAQGQPDGGTEFSRLLLDGLNNKFSRIIFCLPPDDIPRANELITALDCFPVRIDVCASSTVMESLVRDFHISPTRFLINLDDGVGHEWGMLCKRAIDFVFSLAFLLLERFLPVVSRGCHRGIPNGSQIRFESAYLRQGGSNGQGVLDGPA